MAPRLHHRLSTTHVMDREQSKFIEAVSGGWPRLLSNLKSLLETRENRPENPASRWMMGKPKNAVETGGFESRHGVAECRHYARVLRKSRSSACGKLLRLEVATRQVVWKILDHNGRKATEAAGTTSSRTLSASLTWARCGRGSRKPRTTFVG
jgi:hypothetical protein